jgi:hypothetical protein
MSPFPTLPAKAGIQIIERGGRQDCANCGFHLGLGLRRVERSEME